MRWKGSAGMDELVFLEALDTLEHDPDRKHAFFGLCDLYQQGDPQQREYLRSDWFLTQAWTIPRFRAILLEDSYPSEQRLRACLISLSLLPSKDSRGDLMVICPLYHCTVRLRINPGLFFEEIAAISSEFIAALLRSFWQRSEELRSLKAFGYQEECTPDGVYLEDLHPQSVEETLEMIERMLRRPLSEKEREPIIRSKRRDERYTRVESNTSACSETS